VNVQVLELGNLFISALLEFSSVRKVYSRVRLSKLGEIGGKSVKSRSFLFRFVARVLLNGKGSAVLETILALCRLTEIGTDLLLKFVFLSAFLFYCSHTENHVDGIINLQIAKILGTGKGKIHGVDSSDAMIAASKKVAAAESSISKICTFEGSSSPLHLPLLNISS
jgi:hypothetical protein